MATARKPAVKKKVEKKEKEEKLTDAQKEEREEVTKWLERYQAAKEAKKAWRELFRIDLGYEYRDGKQRPSHINDEDWYTINKIYSNLVAELPSLYSNDPYFYIKLEKSYSTNPMDIVSMETKGNIRQAMLNYLKRELELKKKCRVGILDAYFQFGVMKTHFQADMVENPDADKPMTDENESFLYDETSGDPLKEPKMLPVNEAYKITRVHPDRFYFDAEAGPLEDEWSYLFQDITRPLDEAKEDTRYNESARKKLKATEVSQDAAQKAKKQRKKGLAVGSKETEATDALLIEIYDLKKKQWLTVSPGCDEFLIAPGPLPKGCDKHPYSFLRFEPLRDDSPYSIPPVSQWLDPQKAYCEVRSKMASHRKRFNRKYTMVDTAFADPDDAATKLETGEDGTVLRQQNPGQAVYPIQDAQLDQNHLMEIQFLRGDFEELATGANQQGYGAGVDSATEAGIIEKRVVMREGDKQGIVMQFVTDIGRKVDQLVQGNITKDHAVKVDGPEGEYWELVKVDNYDDIDGEFSYSVNVGQATPQIPEIERAQWMSFLQLIANGPQLLMSKTLLKRTAEMFHIYDQTMIDELYALGQKMMSGGQAQPGTQGSIPGVADVLTRAASMTGGAAAGINNIRGGKQ